MTVDDEGAAAYAAHQEAMKASRAAAERVMTQHASGGPAADAGVQAAMAALAQLRPADREAIRRLLNDNAEDGATRPDPTPPPPPPSPAGGGLPSLTLRDLLVNIGSESQFAAPEDWLARPVRVALDGWTTTLQDAHYDPEARAYVLEPWLTGDACVDGTPPAARV